MKTGKGEGKSLFRREERKEDIGIGGGGGRG